MWFLLVLINFFLQLYLFLSNLTYYVDIVNSLLFQFDKCMTYYASYMSNVLNEIKKFEYDNIRKITIENYNVVEYLDHLSLNT